MAEKTGESPGVIADALLKEWRPIFLVRKKDPAYNLLWFTELVNKKTPNDGKARKVAAVAQRVAEALPVKK